MPTFHFKNNWIVGDTDLNSVLYYLHDNPFLECSLANKTKIN